MNMKRSLILSLCVVVAAIGMSTAQAGVDVAMNLRYDNPADPNEGGTWTLVAVDPNGDSDGLVGLVTRFGEATLNGGSGVINGTIGHDINGGALKTANFGGEREFTYGQDPNGSTPGFVHLVGNVGSPSNQGADPLTNASWDNASVIVTGTFAAVRPVFLSASGNVTDGGDVVSTTTIGAMNVRGDSVSVDGLSVGDATRDFQVNNDDFNIVINNFFTTGKDWDTGDVDGTSTGDVNNDDFNAVINNFFTSQTPPAIGAVPEPTSVVLLTAGLLFVSLKRRRD
jgi:hypothetical protein